MMQQKLPVGKLALIFKKYQIVAAYLFGSQAQGKTHAKSDVDIAVRFLKELSLKKTGLLLNELQNIFKNEIDLVDLDTAPLSLQYRIYKEKKMLYAKNRKKEVFLQAKALCLYFDYKYYFDRFMKVEMDRVLSKGFL